MRSEVHHHLFVAAAENPGVGESGHARADLDGDTASVVEDTGLEGPSVGVPDPVGQGAVDDGGPAEDKDHGGDDTATLSDSTNGESSSHSAEHHLVERVEEGGNEGRALRGGSPDLHEAKVCQVADKRVARGCAECERVTPEIPLKYHDGEGHHHHP